MKNKKGASLVQYAIILAFISVGVIGVYSSFGKEINKILNSYLNIFTANNTNVKANAELVKSANIGGTVSIEEPTASQVATPQNPIQTCADNMCKIDFGSFILSGVPEDLQEYVNSNSTSGGVDKMMDVLLQLADELEANGDTAGAADYRELANIGHLIASNANAFENIAKSNSDPYVIKTTSQATNLNIPGGLGSLSAFSSPIYTILTTDSIGSARHNKNALGTDDYNYYAKFNPSASFIDLYDKIMADPKYSPEIQGITTELYLKVSDLLTTQNINVKRLPLSATPPTTAVPMEYFDTDGNKQSQTLNWMSNPTDISAPKVSGNTNFSSAIICAVGHNKDVNNQCNQ